VKERVIYRETYKRKTDVKLSAAITISSLHPRARIERVELQARGILESAESPTGQLEFYEVRIVIRPPA
jgi:hypothetical protein